jgi:rubrerythrin
MAGSNVQTTAAAAEGVRIKNMRRPFAEANKVIEDAIRPIVKEIYERGEDEEAKRFKEDTKRLKLEELRKHMPKKCGCADCVRKGYLFPGKEQLDRGWICPRCDEVHAPWKAFCTNCSPTSPSRIIN